MLLSYVQKAHFKSTHIQKLHLALDVYRGLGTIPTTRSETLAKVSSMLLHPFPKVLFSGAHFAMLRANGCNRFGSLRQKHCGC